MALKNGLKLLSIQKKLFSIRKKLSIAYGYPKPWKMPPIDALIAVILSQNTSDHNSMKAFEKLKKKYPNWKKILAAKESEIAKTILEGGLANIKAKRIKTVLLQIVEKTGKLDLQFLSNYSAKDAREYLMQFSGVGPKSAAVVVAFAFEKPAFPVDTHIFRVLKRIPLIPQNTSYENAHELMEEMCPDALKIPLHAEIIAHGRKICKAQNPICSKCVIKKECARVGVVKSS
ncbi:endonuclease III [Candidatus Micrarchaeota archaeon]|nr:endonuclease III [Candidatus Micrarchaeota archaeon]